MKKTLTFAAFLTLVAAAVFAGGQTTKDLPPPVCPPLCSPDGNPK